MNSRSSGSKQSYCDSLLFPTVTVEDVGPLTLVPGSQRVSGAPSAWDRRWNGPHSIPDQRLEPGPGSGGKRILHIRDSLFEHINKKGLSRANMGKSIKCECVIQILSQPQKHEQLLKFPTHILSAQSGSVTAHKWFDAAWGPVEVGRRIIFSSLQWPRLLTELILSGSRSLHRPLRPPSASCLWGLRKAAGLHLIPDFDSWSQDSTTERKQSRRVKVDWVSRDYLVFAVPSSIWSTVYGTDWPQWEADRGPTRILGHKKDIVGTL